jgi:hypothetical protein
MGEMKIVQKILIGNLEVRDFLGNMCLGGKIILKRSYGAGCQNAYWIRQAKNMLQ